MDEDTVAGPELIVVDDLDQAMIDLIWPEARDGFRWNRARGTWPGSFFGGGASPQSVSEEGRPAKQSSNTNLWAWSWRTLRPPNWSTLKP